MYLFSEKMLMMRPDLMAKVTLPKSYWKKKEKYRIRVLPPVHFLSSSPPRFAFVSVCVFV